MKGSITLLLATIASGLSAADPDLASWLRTVKPSLRSDPTLLCEVCQITIQGLQDLILSEEDWQKEGTSIITEICEVAMPTPICENLVNSYASVIIPAVSGKYLNPEFVCSKVLMCSTPHFLRDNITAVVDEIMADMPPVLPLPTPGNDTYTFIHVSDIHVDLDYDWGSAISCPYPVCCRDDFGMTNDTTRQAGFWGSAAKCDIPLRTVAAFLKQADEMGVDFVLWTGDNPPHAIWQYNKETHLKQSEVLTGVFKTYFKDTPVYPIMGNHAGCPQDQYRYGNEAWLLEGLTDMWATWLTPEAQATHLDNAYWSMKDIATGLRVIAINTQMCDTMNLWLILNDTDPANHLAWLRQELYQAETNEEYVIIIGHIPIGDRFCSSTWAEIYRAIVNRFRNIIRGQFFGHTHNDQFEIVKSLVPNEPPAGVLYIVPGLTTYTGHQPSFRVFEMDKATLQIVNYHNYRLDLDQANDDPLFSPKFDEVYDPLSMYGMRDLTPASWQALSDQMQTTKAFALEYWALFGNSVPTVPACDGEC